MMPNRPRHQGIYLLPNAFTTAALFAGFYAVVQAMNGLFEVAAIAIFVAMVLDGMDGRVARMTHTQSAFGEQYDSLADMVSFGVAPALVVYEWQLRTLGKMGWAAAFIYCACAALRLARFNTQIASTDKRWFQGMPSPTAAALVAGLVWVSHEVDLPKQITPSILPWLAFAFTIFAGFSMVSNVRFYSFKEFNMRRHVPFIGMVALIFAWVLIAQNPPIALFALFVGYSLSGYIMAIWRKIERPAPAKKP